MAKTRSKKGKSTFGQYGDIQAMDPIGQPLLDVFTIELKRGYNSQTIAGMLDKQEKAAPQAWEMFYHQVREDQSNANSLFWMIITKRDRREPMVCISLRAAKELKRCGGDLRYAFHLQGKLRLKKGMPVHIFMVGLSEFLGIISKQHIIMVRDSLSYLLKEEE